MSSSRIREYFSGVNKLRIFVIRVRITNMIRLLVRTNTRASSQICQIMRIFARYSSMRCMNIRQNESSKDSRIIRSSNEPRIPKNGDSRGRITTLLCERICPLRIAFSSSKSREKVIVNFQLCDECLSVKPR